VKRRSVKQVGGGHTEVHKTGQRVLGDAVSRRLWPLESEALCARAERRTGLTDFGDPPVEAALSVLATSLENEADLHPLGRFLMHGHLSELLEIRLRLAAAWRARLGSLEASPIRRPVFITGMPRSGSTFLHELLSQDPDSRSPKVWEIMFPLPAPEAGGAYRDSRRHRANARLWWFRRLAPRADEVHPMRAGTPHECTAIHSFTFLSEAFISTCRIPSYERFLRSGKLGPAYLWERRFLQHLQSRQPTKRWVLKSPDHLYALDELFAVFPDAVIVYIQRDPLEVLRSSLQLTGVLSGLFGRLGDLDELRDREARELAERMSRAMRFRDRHPELAGHFIDLDYSALVADPMQAVSRIYQSLDCAPSQPALEQMRHLTGTRSKYRRRRNASLSDLGLDAAEVHRFRNYCLQFGIPLPSS